MFKNESDPFVKQHNTDNEQQLQATNVRYNFCISFIQRYNKCELHYI